MAKLIEVGSTFGRWTTLTEPDSTFKIECVCTCGVSKKVSKYSLLKGVSLSCGCFKDEVNAKRLTTHGHTSKLKPKNQRLHRIWGQMKQRCTNPKHQYWDIYGKQGISVCPEWQEFSGFLSWANASGYTASSTIDRKDSSKNYTPENCRWTTPTMQCRNRGVFKNSKSGYTGVYFNKVNSRWTVSITLSGKTKRIGTCDSPVEGAALRNQYIIENNLKGFQLADI